MTIIFSYQGERYSVVSTDLLNRRVPLTLVQERGIDGVIKEGDFKACFNEKFRKSKVGNHWIGISGCPDGELTKLIYSTPLKDIEKEGISIFHPWRTESTLAMVIYKPGENLSYCESVQAEHYKLVTIPADGAVTFGHSGHHDFIVRRLSWRIGNKTPEEVARIVHEAVQEVVSRQVPLNHKEALRGVSTYLANHTVRRIARD